MMTIRTYSELITFPTFIERYRYLKLGDKVGESTFGYDRYLNQEFYRSKEWRDIRNYVISRDRGCDLACNEHEIPKGYKIYIHHMNPIRPNDIVHATDYLLNPEYLITVSRITHDAIHYGNEELFTIDEFVERAPNDTCLWRN